MRKLLGAGLAGLLLHWATACGSSPAPEPTPAADAAAISDAGDGSTADAVDATDSAAQCVLTPRFGSEICEKCLRDKCCAPITSCETDAACKTVLGCAADCVFKSSNPGPCIDRCVQATPAGQAKYKAFDDCIAALPDDPSPGCALDCSQ